MKTIIITILLLSPIAQADMGRALMMLNQYQINMNNWQHQQIMQQNAQNAGHSLTGDNQPAQYRQVQQLPECAPNNVYCQRLRQHQLMQQQFEMLDGY